MFDSEVTIELHPAIEENFRELNKELYQNLALNVSELSSLVNEMASFIENCLALDLPVMDALLALRESLNDILSSLHSHHEIAVPASVVKMADSLRENDKAVLISLLLERLEAKNAPLLEKDFLFATDDMPVYAYVKNTLADEAFDVICENVNDPLVKYVPSFSEGVRMLLSGEAGFCLFPIEEKGGLRLPTVENLLFTANLKIRRILPVFGFDGSAELKYALVSRNAYIEPYQKEDDRYLEIHIPFENDFSLESLLFAIRSYEMSLYRIHTFSLERAFERENYISLCIKSQGGSFLNLLTYLTLFCEKHTIVGIYKNLEY